MAATAPPVLEGFNVIGHPIPLERRESAYRALRDDMAPDASVEECRSLVERVADRLERDQPYEAMKEATDAPFGGPPPRGRVDLEADVGYIPDEDERVPYKAMDGLRLDYTGGIRLFSHLLAAPVGGES